MLTLLMLIAQLDLAFGQANFAPAQKKPVRVYISTSSTPAPTPKGFATTIDEPLKRFNRPSMKCVPRPSKPMSEEQKKIQEMTQLKSSEGVEQYLQCYASKNFENYRTEYRDMIDDAAKDFEVDGSLMRCLLNRESQWKSSMVSCTCAMGLGQQTSENLESMKGTVAATLSGPAWTKYMNRRRAKDPQFDNKCSGEFVRSGEVAKHDEFYKTIMKGREPGCGSDAIECKVFRKDDRRCPAASIAAAAAYLKYIDSIIRKAVNCGQLEPWQRADSLVAMALAYNAGEGTAQKALKKADHENTTISINFLDGATVSKGKMRELRLHYRAIRNCLVAGETYPPAPRDTHKPGCFTNIQATDGNARTYN